MVLILKLADIGIAIHVVIFDPKSTWETSSKVFQGTPGYLGLARLLYLLTLSSPGMKPPGIAQTVKIFSVLR